MKKTFLNIAGVLTVGFLLFINLAPSALMQGNLFDPLQNIKEKLQGQNIDVIDYSQNPAGDLSSGESQVNTVILTVVKALKILMLGLSILFVALAGVSMIMAQGDETALTDQKRHLLYAVVGLALILVIDRFVEVIYGVPGATKTLTTFDFQFSDEVLGIVSYLKSLLAIIAVAMIILSGARMLFSFGEEEKLTQQRKVVLWVAAGVILVLVDKVIVENIFSATVRPLAENPNAPSVISQGSVANIIALFATIAKFALGFAGLLALAALLYGAALFITNYASDEQADKGKKIIKSALAGLVIILSAFAVISTLIDFK